MRKIYLIRHAEPSFPGEKHICLSRTDIPLSRLGHMQCVLLQSFFTDKEVASVYHSGLLRTKETAFYIDKSAMEEPAFLELGVGEWEGKSFEEIRLAYPEIYKARGKDPYGCPIPGGEEPYACLKRAKEGLENILKKTDGDIVIVTHSGILRLLLCALLDMPMEQYLEIKLPYASVSIVEYDGTYRVCAIGERIFPQLDEALCETLLDVYEVSEVIRKHCRAVARKACSLSKGCAVNKKALYAAAMLHDICRTEKEHPQAGALLMKKLGYSNVAEIIACHHDLNEEEELQINEKTILYLADKLIQGDREVSLEDRFRTSQKKAETEEAKRAHARRYEQAIRVYSLFKEQ